MIGVTDHALIRWLERVHGIDMEFFRRACAAECQHIIDAGASGGWVGDHWAVVKSGAVITIRDDKPHNMARIRHGNLDDTRPDA